MIAMSESIKQKSLMMMPWFPRDFMSATRGWSVTAKGVYREMLDTQWDMGELPSDPNEIRTVIGATESEWAAGWAKAESKFPLNCSGRKNPKLEEHRIKALQLSEKRSKVGKIGGEVSAQKRQASSAENQTYPQSSNSQPIGEAIGQAKVNHPSPSPSPSLLDVSSLEQPLSKKSRGKRAPGVDFDPKTIPGLNLEAWETWVSYRAARKPAIKPFSMESAAKSLAAFGRDQMQVVENSKANGYQGLVPPKVNLGGAPTRPLASAEKLGMAIDPLVLQAAKDIGYRPPYKTDTVGTYRTSIMLDGKRDKFEARLTQLREEKR